MSSARIRGTRRPWASLGHRWRALCLPLVFTLGSTPAWPQLEPPIEALSSSPRDFFRVNDRLYFSADDGIHGRELWVYDVEEGCRLVKDFVPGAESGEPICRAVHGDFLYLSARNPEGGSSLWQWDDRTRSATLLHSHTHKESHARPHVHARACDIPALYFTLCDTSRAWNVYTMQAGEDGLRRITDFPAQDSVTQTSSGIVLPNGIDVFRAHDFVWRSDGTSEGTTRLTKSGLGMSADEWIQPLGHVAILKLRDGVHGKELWRTDGTTEGTLLLGDIRPGPEDSGVGQSGRLHDTLFFGADDGVSGVELWRTDSTPEGTMLLMDINPGRASSDPHYFKSTTDTLFFAADDGRHGIELWRTDGTPEGTRMVKDIDPASGSSSPYHLAAVGDVLCFGATTPVHGDALWVSDGTASGTRLLADLVPGNGPGGPAHLTELNGKLVLAYTEPLHGEELWMGNVTSGDMRLLADIHIPIINPSANPEGLTAFGNAVCFVAHDLTHGKELWISEGSDASTQLVKDINPGEADSSPEQLTAGDRLVFFTASTVESGRELWCSDGTSRGTRLLSDIMPGPDDSSPLNLTPVGQGLYFTAVGGNSRRSVWYTDGTPEGTLSVGGFNARSAGTQVRRLFAHMGEVYAYVQREKGLILYSLSHDDGPATPILEIPPGGTPPAWHDENEEKVSKERLLYWMYPPNARGDAEPVAFCGEYYFVANTALYGAELWRTDAQTAGVALVCDAFPGRPGSSPRRMTVFKERLYFVAEHPTFGQVLWSTDGSPRGTEVLRPILADSILPPVSAMALAPIGSILVILGRDAGNNVDLSVPPRLHALDKTGIRSAYAAIASLPSPPGGLGVSQLTTTGSRVFFTADDGRHGNELWVLGEDLKGSMVKDILRPGDLKPLRK